MKVLIYENSSGFANYCHKLCNALVVLGDEVSYMTDSVNIYAKNIDDKVNYFPVLKITGKVKGKGIHWVFDRLFVALSNIHIRNKNIKKNDYDVVNIQWTIPIIDQFFIKRITKRTKVVLTVHDVIPPIKSFYWTEKSLNKIYNAANLLIVHSENNKIQLQQKFKISAEKIRVIHHGTDTTYPIYSKEECFKHLGITPTENKIFLFFGLIREQKGLDDLIQAVNGMREDCKILIAGAMPNGESFEQYNEQILDQDKYIKMIKFIDEDDVDYIYQMCDAVVFPYKYFSSQSGVFMQCIKYRKPMIATDVGSFKQYIEEYNCGFVVEPCNSNMLQEVMDNFVCIETRGLQEMINNLETAAQNNSWEKAAELYHEAYSEQLID